MDHYVVVHCENGDQLRDILTHKDFPTDAIVLTPELAVQSYEKVSHMEADAARDYCKETAGVPDYVKSVSEEKNLTLFLGTAREEGDNLYNSVICVEDGKEIGYHDKIKLYRGKGSTEPKIFDIPQGWNGNIEIDNTKYSSVICIETNHVMRRNKPKPLYDDIASFEPDVLLVSAYWPNAPDLVESNLRSIIRSMDAKAVFFANAGNRSGGIYVTEDGGSSVVFENGTCRQSEIGWIDIETDFENHSFVNNHYILEK